ncbi:hypothetical protein [Halobaculum sp. P14]|uniref:hypothetical protein n=1 Tax=Halobaculum sp. P14 TaxID=3421638 RepID=UPI003EBED347
MVVDGKEAPPNPEQPSGPRTALRRAWTWVLLDGSRWWVTAALLALLFVVLGPVGHALLAVVEVETALAERHTVVPLVSTFLSGNFLLVSIVVSVSSLFVSQEQNTLPQQFGRVQSVVEYRRRLEDVAGLDHAPAAPERLLRVLSAEVLERAQQLQDELRAVDVDVRADVDAYVSSLSAETGEMNRELDGGATTFDVMLATMDYDHDRQINDLRGLRAEYGDALDERAEDRIDELLTLLQYFATAREYFKTVYMRQEFARLSRNLVVVSLPTIGLVSFALLHLNRLPQSHYLIVTVHVVALAPFTLLSVYVLRVSAVSSRTQAAGQFVAGRSGGDIRGPRED